MIYVNIPDAEYKASEKSTVRGGVQYWFARFNNKSTDGVTHAVEHEIDHEPKAADFTALKAQWTEHLRDCKKLAVEGYAKTDVVKCFEVNGNKVWLDSEARTSLAKAVADKRAAGREKITLYLGGVGYEMTLDKADEILSAVEVYASDCYEVTENHKSAIAAAAAKDVEDYDYTQGYPSHPAFTL